MTEIQINLYGALSLFGTLQGLILVLIFVSSRTFAKKSNKYLSIILLVFSVLNLVGALEEMDVYNRYPVMRFVPIIWYSIIPPCLYLFVRHLTTAFINNRFWVTTLFVPFVLDFSFQVVELVRFLTGNLQVPGDLEHHYFVVDIFESIAAILTLIISIWSIRSISKYEESLYENFADIQDKSLLWLKRTLFGGCVLTLVWISGALIDFFPNQLDNLLTRTLWIGLSVLIYWIGYSMLMKRELFLSGELASLVSPESAQSNLSDKADKHYEKLLDVMSNQQIYQDPELNMSKLATITKLSKGYLSQIINQKEGKNFFDFVNSYRIKEVQERFSNPAYEHFSIMAIALDAGFKSKSTFNSVFKKMTGVTPSQYRTGHSKGEQI